MLTRSQSIAPFIFDFDESSAEWKANKRKLQNGCYTYICGTLLRTGEKCMKKPLKNKEKCSQCSRQNP